MLTSPNAHNRPLFAARDINQFYLDNCPKIFPRKKMGMLLKAMKGPKYDGKYLHSIVRQLLGGTRIHQTLTNVIIPTFDIKSLQHTIFTNFETKSSALKDALLSDVCISTSAAPTYLPGHQFTTFGSNGNTRAYNLVDGGVTANNLVAKEPIKINGNEVLFSARSSHYFDDIVFGTGYRSTAMNG